MDPQALYKAIEEGLTAYGVYDDDIGPITEMVLRRVIRVLKAQEKAPACAGAESHPKRSVAE